MADYVNNKKFYEEYCIWKTEWRQAKSNNAEPPVLTRYLGECIMKVCDGLSYRYNFINYSYREELVEDGIEACLNAIHKFDEVNYKNIFSYLTQVAFHAFVRRIKIEKKQHNIKIELIKDSLYEGISRQEFDTEEYQTQMREIIMSTIDANSRDDKIREMGIIGIEGGEDVVVTFEEMEEPETNMDIFND